MRASKRNAAVFRLSDKLEFGAARVRRFCGAETEGSGERSRSKSRRSQDAGKPRVSDNSGREAERSGSASRWSGSLAALEWSGVGADGIGGVRLP